jgi:hypothetical protein
MREIEEILKDICEKRGALKQMEDQRMSIMNSMMNPALRDELTQPLQKYITIAKGEVDAAVSELIRWPPHKVEHFAKLKQFLAEYPYEKSVFIMTKYPGKPPTPLDLQLQKVIDTVHEAVTNCGYIPHLASDKKYQPELFRNIEVYMLGCSKAIAIVESKHTHELNPNVTMEWGWFRSTDRDVLFLVEKDFDKDRADIGGLIKDEFEWDAPEPGIKAAVEGFLKS